MQHNYVNTDLYRQYTILFDFCFQSHQEEKSPYCLVAIDDYNPSQMEVILRHQKMENAIASLKAIQQMCDDEELEQE